MTKEELEKEAKDFWWNDDNCSGALPTEKIYECGYLAGAEPREKRIAELEAQIEKMKCCENCKHSNTTCECYTICTIGHYDDCKSNTVLDSLDKKDYWEN